MKLYPKEYLESVTDITNEFMNKNKLKGLILDVDNTLIDFDKKLDDRIIEWCDKMKKSGIKICILSNTNKIEKVTKVAEKLDLHFFYFAKKPMKGGFKRAQEYLKLESQEIGVVGDQIFTDVIGANLSKMFPILVKPIDKRDILPTRIKRPLEKFVIKCYIRKKNKGKI